jgi:hypothetical protein
MKSKLQKLIWQEWRQRRTQLAVCLLVMVSGTAYCIAGQWWLGFRNPADSFFVTAFTYGVLMPIFLAMRTSLGESTDRTRSFSDGLPISARQRGWIRLAGGAAVLVLPIVVGALLLSVVFGSAGGMAWYGAAGAAWSATCLYLLLSLLGTTLRAESHLGYCGAALAVLWFLAVNLGEYFRLGGYSEIADWIGAVAPQSCVESLDRWQHGSFDGRSIFREAFGPLLVNTVIQIVLAAMFVRRYSRRLPASAAEPARKTVRRFSRRPRLSTRERALAWLAWRQSVPMCLPGLAIAFLLAAMDMDMGFGSQGRFLQRYFDSLPRSMAVIGIPWAVVVGAGIFSPEIDWRIGEFWRTRPISALRLFGVKFVAGLLAVLLVLDGSVIAATWFSPHWGQGHNSMSWRYIACFVPLHATMFAVAVAWTCLVRQAVLGGMAAFATLMLTEMALSWSPVTENFSPAIAYDHLHNGAIDFTHGYPVVIAELILTLVASILIGWLALRRYDPRRLAG